MPKALATLITFAALVSAVAQAPGVPFGKSERPLSAGADVGDTQPSIDQGAWLDTALSDAQIRIASWHHTWTDTETDPDTYYATPGANGHSARYEPEGVLLASAPHDASEDFTGSNFFGPNLNIHGGAHGSRSKGSSGTPPKVGNGPTDEVPATDDPTESSESGPAESSNEQPPATDDVPVTTPTDEITNTPPLTEEPPASVPEPMTMSLFALGIAGMLMFGRKRTARGAL